VAEHFGVSEAILLGRNRSRDVALPRQVAMVPDSQRNACLAATNRTHLGGRDHTTVLYACGRSKN